VDFNGMTMQAGFIIWQFCKVQGVHA